MSYPPVRSAHLRVDALQRGKFIITKVDYESAIKNAGKKLGCSPADVRFWLPDQSGYFEIGADEWDDAISDAKEIPVVVVTAASDPNQGGSSTGRAGGLDSPLTWSVRDTPISVDNWGRPPESPNPASRSYGDTFGGGYTQYERAPSVQYGGEPVGARHPSHWPGPAAATHAPRMPSGYDDRRERQAYNDYYPARASDVDTSYDPYRAPRSGADRTDDRSPHLPANRIPSSSRPRTSGAASFIDSSYSWYPAPPAAPAAMRNDPPIAHNPSNDSPRLNSRTYPEPPSRDRAERPSAHSAPRANARDPQAERPVAGTSAKASQAKPEAEKRKRAYEDIDEDLVPPADLQKKKYGPSTSSVGTSKAAPPAKTSSASTSHEPKASNGKSSSSGKSTAAAASSSKAAASGSSAPRKQKAAPAPSEEDELEEDGEEIDWGEISANAVSEKSSGKKWDNATCTKLIRALSKELKKRKKEMEDGERDEIGNSDEVFEELIKRNNFLRDRTAAAIKRKCRTMLDTAQANGKLRSIPLVIREFLLTRKRDGSKRTSDVASDSEPKVRSRFRKKPADKSIAVTDDESDGGKDDEEEEPAVAPRVRRNSTASAAARPKVTKAAPTLSPSSKAAKVKLNGVSERAKRAAEANRTLREQHEQEEDGDSSLTDSSSSESEEEPPPQKKPRPLPRPARQMTEVEEQRRQRQYEEEMAATNPFSVSAARLSQPPERLLPVVTPSTSSETRKPLFLQRQGVQALQEDWPGSTTIEEDPAFAISAAQDEDSAIDALDETRVEAATGPRAPNGRRADVAHLNGTSSSDLALPAEPATVDPKPATENPPRSSSWKPAILQPASPGPPPIKPISTIPEAVSAEVPTPEPALPQAPAPPPPAAAPGPSAPAPVPPAAPVVAPASLADIDPADVEPLQLPRNYAVEELNGLSRVTAFDTLAHVAQNSDPVVDFVRVHARKIIKEHVSSLASPAEARYQKLGSELAQIIEERGDTAGDTVFVPLIYAVFAAAFECCDKLWSLRKVSLLACLTLISVSRSLSNKIKQYSPSDRNYKEQKLARPYMPHRRFRAYITAFLLEGCLKTGKAYDESIYKSIFIRDNLAMFVALQPFCARMDWALEAAFRPLAEVTYTDANEQLERLQALQDLIKKCKTALDLATETSWIQHDYLCIKTDPAPSGQLWEKSLPHSVPPEIKVLLHDASSRALPRLARLATDPRVSQAADSLCSEVVGFCSQFERKDPCVAPADRAVILLSREDSKRDTRDFRKEDLWDYASVPPRPCNPTKMTEITMRAQGKKAIVVFFNNRQDRDNFLLKLDHSSMWRPFLKNTKLSQEEATYLMQTACAHYNLACAVEEKETGRAPATYRAVKPEPVA